MSVMARWAATPRICESPNDVIGLDDGCDAGRERQRRQQINPLFSDDLVDQPLGGSRQHQAGAAADEHEDEPDAKPTAVGPDELARFPPRGRGSDAILLHGLHRLARHCTTSGTLTRGHHPQLQVCHAIIVGDL